MHLTEEDRILIFKKIDIKRLQCRKVNEGFSYNVLKEDDTERSFKATERQWFGAAAAIGQEHCAPTRTSNIVDKLVLSQEDVRIDRVLSMHLQYHTWIV